MMVKVDFGDGIIRELDESRLTRKDLRYEDEREITTVTEYYLHGERVHRSAHVRLKHGIGIEGILGRI